MLARARRNKVVVMERVPSRRAALMERHRPLVVPSAHDALAARLIERAGFPAYSDRRVRAGRFPLWAARHRFDPSRGTAGLRPGHHDRFEPSSEFMKVVGLEYWQEVEKKFRPK